MIAFGSPAPVGILWSTVRSVIGTCRAMLCTFRCPQRVATWLVGQRNHVEGVEWPQAAKVEDRAQIDEERIVALAGKDLRPVIEREDRLAADLGLVVRLRARTDVDWRYDQVHT